LWRFSHVSFFFSVFALALFSLVFVYFVVGRRFLHPSFAQSDAQLPAPPVPPKIKHREHRTLLEPNPAAVCVRVLAVDK